MFACAMLTDLAAMRKYALSEMKFAYRGQYQIKPEYVKKLLAFDDNDDYIRFLRAHGYKPTANGECDLRLQDPKDWTESSRKYTAKTLKLLDEKRNLGPERMRKDFVL